MSMWMVTLRYIGSATPVHVPSLGIIVEHGDTVSVEEESVAAFTCQKANWEVHEPTPKKRDPARPDKTEENA